MPACSRSTPVSQDRMLYLSGVLALLESVFPFPFTTSVTGSTKWGYFALFIFLLYIVTRAVKC